MWLSHFAVEVEIVPLPSACPLSFFPLLPPPPFPVDVVSLCTPFFLPMLRAAGFQTSVSAFRQPLPPFPMPPFFFPSPPSPSPFFRSSTETSLPFQAAIRGSMAGVRFQPTPPSPPFPPLLFFLFLISSIESGRSHSDSLGTATRIRVLVRLPPFLPSSPFSLSSPFFISCEASGS